MRNKRRKRQPFKSPRLSEDKKNQIASLYKDGNCPLKISRELHITSKTVYGYLDKFGLREFDNCKGIRRKYIINDSYFDLLDTTEKVYWLGFLAAHSNLHKDMKFILIEVSAKDLSHLQSFLLALGSTYCVHHKMINGYIIYYVKIYSSQIIANLNRYTFYDESGNLIWPRKFDKEYHSHYIRGYFDGKGYWAIYPETKTYIFSIRSPSLRFITKLKDIIQTECKLNDVKIINKKSCFIIQYTGIAQCHRIYNYLYRDADAYSERKREGIARIFVPKDTIMLI